MKIIMFLKKDADSERTVIFFKHKNTPWNDNCHAQHWKTYRNYKQVLIISAACREENQQK